MEDAKALQVITTKASDEYKTNKATATNLKPNTRYYYSYTITESNNNYKNKNPK
ncbi:MAG: hypothetical protein V8S33_07055 [Intestinibacter bartlettii]